MVSQEWEEQIKKGLCFNCDEKWVKGHKCKHFRNFQVVDEDEDEVLEDDSPLPLMEDAEHLDEGESERRFSRGRLVHYGWSAHTQLHEGIMAD